MDTPLNWAQAGGWRAMVHTDHIFAALRSLLVLGVAFISTPVARRTLVRVMEGRWSRQQVMLANRIITYLCWGVAVAIGLRELGFESMTPLLGAAGIFSVAIGFASQTSFSNLISGMFLIGEQAFVVGESIDVNGVVGEVLGIDWLSVKLRTTDNLMVRIPNETMLRAQVTNMSRFPIRRLDMELNIGYSEDIERVKKVLYDVATNNVLGLDDPKPVFVFLGFADSSLRLQFSVWGKRENFVDLKNSMYDGIKRAFAQANIDMPYPHRALVAGSAPVRVVVDGVASAPSEGRRAKK